MFKIFNNKKILQLFIFQLFLLILFITTFDIDVNAEDKTMHVTYTGTYSNGHVKHKIKLDGDTAYCIQFGVQLKDLVSDLDNILIGNKTLDEYTTSTIKKTYDKDGENKWLGWGVWEENDDHTASIAKSKDGAPSGGTVGSTTDVNTTNAKDVYTVEYTSLDVGWSEEQKKALALLNYYLPDSGASEEVHQVLVWAIEKGYFTTRGNAENFNTKFSSGFDDYCKEFLSGNYGQMKLYREVVWKLTNLQQIPSFASRSYIKALLSKNKIHLKYDAKANNGTGGYTATVADENGMLKYFNMENSTIDGCTIEQNTANGTVTITTNTKNPFTGSKSNKATAHNSESTLIPSSGTFGYASTWRWKLEGKAATFKYSYQEEVDGHKYKSYADDGWQCEWKCTTASTVLDGCDGKNNSHTCTSDCAEECTGTINTHTHGTSCYHANKCTCREAGVHTSTYNSNCTVTYTCSKQHIKTYTNTTPRGEYIDWQDIEWEYEGGPQLMDPPTPYIVVVCDVEENNSETDVDILLVAEESTYNNKTYRYDDGTTIKYADHIIPNEEYKLVYIYSYRGASKGFEIETINKDIPYYKIDYTARILHTEYTENPTDPGSIYSLRNSFEKTTKRAKYSKLKLNPTNITIKGIYKTAETNASNTYPSKLYTYNSGNNWNTTIKIDALKSSDFPETAENEDILKDYTILTANEVKASNTNNAAKSVKVDKKGANDILITWTYETDYEVFTTATLNATAYIKVGKDKNYSKTFFTNAYNYGNMANHNYVGNNGYFNKHVLWTKNSQYQTYAIKNAMWQTEVTFELQNLMLNTGAGITQPIYEKPGTSYHPVNYFLYYTIEGKNPHAYYKSEKLRQKNGEEDVETTTESQTINTSSEVYEFDLNDNISFGASGGTLASFNGNFSVVDHVRTGGNKTYFQRVIPTNLTILSSGSATMKATININNDHIVYEDSYHGYTTTGEGINKRWKMKLSNCHYNNNSYDTNKLSVTDTIYPAMNPNIKRPTNISNSENITGDNYSTPTTSFKITMSNGKTKTVKDSRKKNYTEYKVTFNIANANNKVTFPDYRKSTTLFKYSKTSYSYNSKNIRNEVSVFNSSSKSQTERYYISQILFKSNYTTKYRKELEQQGASYINEYDSNGGTISWIDMVNQNDFAIVEAGQGFELKVTVKYHNSYLTQYLARYFGYDDARYKSGNVGSSKEIKGQYCNISPMTGGYLSGFTTLDRIATLLVTGSNTYYDLYTYMSDNYDTVYSALGMYDTPIIYDRKISYSPDYATTTIVYTMKKSVENGVNSSYQTLKFYTNQLATDSTTQGIINGATLGTDKHSITIWTPIIAATGFDYPNTIQDRYIGDAIELGYTIKTTGADDSIVHIVQ